MKNLLISLIKNKNKCTHKNALNDTNEGYCPDCGKYLVKNYYILRCSRCGIKRESKLVWDEIVPAKKYCKNCGEVEYYIEKINKINFIDANYAISLKESVAHYDTINPEAQIWVDEQKEIKQIKAN